MSVCCNIIVPSTVPPEKHHFSWYFSKNQIYLGLEEHAKLISPWYGPVVISIITTPIIIQANIPPERIITESDQQPSEKHQRSAEIQILSVEDSRGEVSSRGDQETKSAQNTPNQRANNLEDHNRKTTITKENPSNN